MPRGRNAEGMTLKRNVILVLSTELRQTRAAYSWAAVGLWTPCPTALLIHDSAEFNNNINKKTKRAAFLVAPPSSRNAELSGVILHLFHHLFIHILVILHAVVADPLGDDAR